MWFARPKMGVHPTWPRDGSATRISKDLRNAKDRQRRSRKHIQLPTVSDHEVKIRIGIHPAPQWGAALVKINAAALISANALWRKEKGQFRKLKPGAFGGHTDIALDSAGFVAMFLYGGYRWTTRQYVELAGFFPWAWWASMDYCCEPQIAANAEEVQTRVRRTVTSLIECRLEAEAQGIKAPMPVLQGWQPDDYVKCAEMMGDLPNLVGLGSVCRRHLLGKDGIFAVLGRLDRVLPSHVKLHLFGVKGQAITALLGHPRIASIDSMAWDAAARKELEQPRTVAKRQSYMLDWYRRQVPHPNLFGAAA